MLFHPWLPACAAHDSDRPFSRIWMTSDLLIWRMLRIPSLGIFTSVTGTAPNRILTLNGVRSTSPRRRQPASQWSYTRDRQAST